MESGGLRYRGVDGPDAGALAGGDTLGGLGQLRELTAVGCIGTPIIHLTWGGGVTFARHRGDHTRLLLRRYHECLDRLPPIEQGRIRAPEGALRCIPTSFCAIMWGPVPAGCESLGFEKAVLAFQSLPVTHPK